MKKKINCLICDKEVTNNNSYIGSHVKRIHHINLSEYVIKFYKELCKFIPDTCGFCNNVAVPDYHINHDNLTFSRNYSKFLCNTDKCKDSISMEYFGVLYKDCKHFDKVGSKSDYIARSKKIDKDKVKLSKSKGLLDSDFVSNKEGYIKKYGDIIGLKKYYERCDKIGRGNTLNWYIEKYGLQRGTERYNSYLSKIKKNTLGTSISKCSNYIFEYLQKNNIECIPEYSFTYDRNKKSKRVDFYLPTEKIVIEFFGDYWHANPAVYKSDYYNSTVKLTASEIWKRDEIRIKLIRETFNDDSIIIIWENAYQKEECNKFNKLMDAIAKIKGIKTVIEI